MSITAKRRLGYFVRALSVLMYIGAVGAICSIGAIPLAWFIVLGIAAGAFLAGKLLGGLATRMQSNTYREERRCTNTGKIFDFILEMHAKHRRFAQDLAEVDTSDLKNELAELADKYNCGSKMFELEGAELIIRQLKNMYERNDHQLGLGEIDLSHKGSTGEKVFKRMLVVFRKDAYEQAGQTPPYSRYAQSETMQEIMAQHRRTQQIIEQRNRREMLNMYFNRIRQQTRVVDIQQPQYYFQGEHVQVNGYKFNCAVPAA